MDTCGKVKGMTGMGRLLKGSVAFVCAFGVLALAVVAIPEALAQTTGGVTGKVLDGTTGAGLSGATVRVLNAGGSAVKQGSSRTGGSYTLTGVSPGDYTLELSKAGYTTHSEPIAIAAGSTVNAGNDSLFKLPTVTLKINNGAASTGQLAVTLNLTVTGGPTEYLASERDDFSDAQWKPYAAAPPFELTPGTGGAVKTVYVKVRNALGESPRASDTINLALPTVTLKINNGASSTPQRGVILNMNATGAPFQFLASESPNFDGALWQDYSPAAPFVLSAGTGSKTVYVKVRNAVGESAKANDAITVTPPSVTVKINNGNAATGRLLVTLNLTATGSPTDYMASESPDFVGAAWQAFQIAPSFQLMPGTGTRTVHVKVRNDVGESARASDTITVSAPTVALKINNGAATTSFREVTLNMSATGEPVDYLVSESPAFLGAAWQSFNPAPKFILATPGNGTKTVYVKVRTEVGESAVASDTITLDETGGVTGKLLDGSPTGAGLTGATVKWGTKSTTTATGGTFTLNGIDPGPQTLTFSKTGYLDRSIQVNIERGQTANAGTQYLTKILSYTYTPLLPAGWTYAEACGLNNSNQVVGIGFDAMGNGKAFLYSAGRYTILSNSLFADLAFIHLNDSGRILAGGYDDFGEYGVYLSAAPYTTLTKVCPPGWTETDAFLINKNGQVLGHGMNVDLAFRSFLHLGGSSYKELIPDSWTDAYAYDLNHNGQVVGTGVNAAGKESFFLYSGGSNGQYTELYPPGWETDSRIIPLQIALNDHGAVAGLGVADLDCTDGARIYLYSSGNYTELVPPFFCPPSFFTDPGSKSIMMSNTGDLVAYGFDEVGILRTYLYRGGDFFELTPPDLTDVSAVKINALGQVLLSGWDVDSNERFFVFSDGQYVEVFPTTPTTWFASTVTDFNDKGALSGFGSYEDARYNPWDKGFLAVPK